MPLKMHALAAPWMRCSLVAVTQPLAAKTRARMVTSAKVLMIFQNNVNKS